VFVVAIAELGIAFAEQPSVDEFARYLGLFVAVWWAWAGFTFYATRFDTDDLAYRALTLLGMFGVAALATTIPAAFDEAPNGFALTYAGIRIVICLLYARAWRHVGRARPLATWFLLMFGTAIAFWLASLAVATPWKYVLWAVALAFELAAPPRAWRLIRNAPIHPAHIPERFGLLTIIVLGEGVIAVVIGTVDVSWTVLSGTTAFAGFLAAVSIWWIYFEFFDSSVVARSVFGGMTFVYAHYFVAVGIAALGVGVRLTIESAGAGDHYDHAGWIVAVGAAACMAALGVIQLVTPPTIFDADVALRFTSAAFAATLATLTNVLSPIVILWLVVASLGAQVVYELTSHDEHHPLAGAAV
jgi:low temperature requirement protein LtrA